MTIPFSAIMLRGFFDNVPDSREVAAMVDGASRFGALWRIIIPGITPGVIATFISSFNIEWGPMSAAAVLTILPTMIAFVIRWIVAGLTQGAAKG